MQEIFEKRLKELIKSSTPFTEDIGRYILDSGGKRLRPKLVGLIGGCVDLEEERIQSLACTVELMHTASLLHDDVVDSTEIRRSRPTANQVFGDKPALLAGDYISAKAMEITCMQGNIDLAVKMVTTIKKMAEGELKELQHASSFHDNMDIYLDIIYLKTAVLFEFCVYAPAVLAGIPQDKIDAVLSYGKSVGMGFQIVDDIIDLTPSTDNNKDTYNDIAEGKSTLPLVLLFKERPDILREIREIDPDRRQDLIVSNMSVEILKKSSDIAKKYCDEALAALGNAGYLTPELAKVPAMILGQLDNRF